MVLRWKISAGDLPSALFNPFPGEMFHPCGLIIKKAAAPGWYGRKG